MTVSNDLKELKIQFDEIRKQLSIESKQKITKLDHVSIIPTKITRELSKLLKIVPNSELSRADIYHRFYIYLIKNNLINSDQTFPTTEKLETVLDLTKQETKSSLSIKINNTDKFLVKNRIHIANIITMLEHNFI
jgi:hypothetical protein